ncbi:hypothetical protein KC851_00740 [Candidatus Kaiserbacteria bacterium]|nr:hypothetical protein [Candidatus Kaiserbacteria bacterium]
MKRFSEQLHKKSESVKLTVSERADLRERLVSYMEYHPLPAELRTKAKVSHKKTIEQLQAEPFSVFSIPFHSIFKYSSALAVLALVVIPFVAEKSVPGDTLYAIKVKFNEELVSTLTIDSYEKVEWETERLNRRIAEARLLASEGLLTDEVEAEVAEAVREHTASAQREIAALRNRDVDAAAIATISLDTTLEVQSASLKQTDAMEAEVIALGQEKEIISKTSNLIVNAIEESLANKEENKASSSLPAYERTMAKVEQNTTRIHELLTSLQKVVSEKEWANLSRRSTDLERALAEAVAARTESEEEAKGLLVEVLQQTQKLIVFLTELEVVETVDIETLIPVVLTEPEKRAEMNKVQTEIDTKINQIDSSLVDLPNQDLVEKLNFARVEIDDKLSQLATTTDEFAEFKQQSTHVLVLINDVILLLETNGSLQNKPVLPLGEELGTSTASTTEQITEIDQEEGEQTEETSESESPVVSVDTI